MLSKAYLYPFSIIYYIIFVCTLILFHIIQVFCYKLLGYTAHKIAVDWLNFFLMRCLNLLGTRFYLSNPHIMPSEGPMIIVSNHQSTYDIPPIIWFFRKYHPKFISKESLGAGIPSVSYNLRHGGSVLINRKNPQSALIKIKSFAQQVQKKQWAAVIFPEGTRSRDGQPKKFYSNGLITLFDQIPDATVVALSINNSWRLAQYRYFPIPMGISLNLSVEGVLKCSDYAPKELSKKVEGLILQGVQTAKT